MTTAPPAGARSSRAARGKARCADAGAKDAAAGAPATGSKAAEASSAGSPTANAQATAASPDASVGIRPAPYDGDRPDERAGDRFGAGNGNRPDARAGDHPDPHGGDEADGQGGDRVDAHDSSLSDTLDGDRPEARDTDRADRRGSGRPDAREGDRIAKWLARAGIASRRDAERLIADGKVSLNGQKVTHPATFVASGDIVQVAGQVVDAPDRARLWRYHKPDGLMTTHKDPEGRPTVFDKMPAGMPRVVSVGRLDLNSEGLLLLTNDGALARQLELPANGWIRRYRVRVHGAIEPRALADLARGLTIDGVRYAGIEAGLDSRKGTNAWLTVSLKEGRNREIRRVMQHLQLSVTRLIRVAYGPFQLGNMERGEVSEVAPKVLREQLPQAK